MPYGYLIELKYMNRTEGQETQNTLISKAQDQLKQYLADDRLKRYGTCIQWKGLILVWKGWELVHLSEF